MKQIRLDFGKVERVYREMSSFSTSLFCLFVFWFFVFYYFVGLDWEGGGGSTQNERDFWLGARPIPQKETKMQRFCGFFGCVLLFSPVPLLHLWFLSPLSPVSKKKKNSKEEEEEDKRQQKGPQLNVQARQMRGIGSAYNQCARTGGERKRNCWPVADEI